MAAPVTQAIATLRAEGRSIALEMIGFPGISSAQGRAWSIAAAKAGCPVKFTGALDPASLSKAIAHVDLIVFPDPCGPTSRRTTLASILAHGVPAVTFDGTHTWNELRIARAVEFASQDGVNLADVLRTLLDDDAERFALSRRAREFHRLRMSCGVVAKQVAQVAGSVTADGVLPGRQFESRRKLIVVSHACVVPVNQAAFVELAKRGWDITIVVPAQWRHDYARQAFSPTALDFSLEIMPIRIGMVGNVQGHAYLGVVKRVLAMLQPDVLFIEEEAFSVPAAQWARAALRMGIPFGVQMAENRDRRFPYLPRSIRNRVLPSASFVAARSPTASDLARQWGASGDVAVVPHAVPQWSSLSSPRGVHDSFTVGFAGRLVPEKGIWDLVEAIRMLPPPVRLLFVGDGPLRGALECANLPGSHIEVRHNVKHENMPEAYSEMDVLVLPSHSFPDRAEQFGRVLVEALSCRVPVIASEAGEMPWVVDVTGGGRTFPEGDAATLSSLIEAFRQDRSSASGFAAEGARVVAERFSAQAVARTLDELLNRVIAPSKG